MEIQSWMIRSWPSVEWYLPTASAEWPVFRHVGTQVYEQPDAEGRCYGNTVWVSRINGQASGAAWEWTEFRSGVVVLTDPNAIISNIRLRSELGLSATAGLNHIAHTLPWKEAVCRVIQAMRAQVPCAPAPTAALAPRGAAARARARQRAGLARA